MSNVRTRFAPSPTGKLHIGGARTALFCQLYAHHCGGKYLVRIEDTDVERSTQENIDIIKRDLGWLGLSPDEPYVMQSKNVERHKDVVKELLANGHAYEDDGAVRLRVPHPEDGKTSWNDLVQGQIDYPHDSPSMKDFVIQRSDGTPLYNLAVVVDDHDMAITHVVRGDDHINNTPKQILLFQAMGWDVPQFAHVPLIHGPDGKKMSKRHGATGAEEFKNAGYLPAALKTYLMRLGWSLGDEEIISMEKALKHFELSDVNKGASVFDYEKLNWVNSQFIQEMPNDELFAALLPFLPENTSEQSKQWINTGISDLKQRAKTLIELAQAADIYISQPPFKLDEKQQTALNDGQEHLSNLKQLFENNTNWSEESLHGIIQGYVEQSGAKFKHVGMPLRLAVTGKSGGPSMSAIMTVLGRETVLQRLEL